MPQHAADRPSACSICPSVGTHPVHATARVIPHRVLLPSLLEVGVAPLGSKTKYCAPARRCSTTQDQTREQRIHPKEKMLQYTPITKYTRYIAGVGPLKQQLERGPHYSTNNVQRSVAYNNPNEHCASKTPATRCAGLPKGTHITTVDVPKYIYGQHLYKEADACIAKWKLWHAGL